MRATLLLPLLHNAANIQLSPPGIMPSTTVGLYFTNENTFCHTTAVRLRDPPVLAGPDLRREAGEAKIPLCWPADITGESQPLPLLSIDRGQPAQGGHVSAQLQRDKSSLFIYFF